MFTSLELNFMSRLDPGVHAVACCCSYYVHTQSITFKFLLLVLRVRRMYLKRNPRGHCAVDRVSRSAAIIK